MNLNSFEQLINEHTHFPRDDIVTCIDLIFTNNKFAFVDNGVIPSIDPQCKHQIIQGKNNFHISSPPKYDRKVWDYKMGDVVSIRNHVLLTDWLKLFGGKSIDEMTDIFTNKLVNIAKSHIPSKTITVDDKDAPWISAEVRTAIRKNKRVYKTWVQRGKIMSDKNHVNSVQKDTNRIIKKAKEHYISGLSAKICDPSWTDICHIVFTYFL